MFANRNSPRTELVINSIYNADASVPVVVQYVLTGSSANVQDGARLDIAGNGFWGGGFE